MIYFRLFFLDLWNMGPRFREDDREHDLPPVNEWDLPPDKLAPSDPLNVAVMSDDKTKTWLW